MKIAKWGNSLAVRLPSDVVERLGVKEGDEIQLHPIEAEHAAILRRLTREEMWERVRKYRGIIPADFKFDREEANRRG